MGNLAHIGRVGALAAALGVGLVLTAGPGLAYADPTDTRGSSNSSTDAVRSAAPSRAPRATTRRRSPQPSDTNTTTAPASSSPVGAAPTVRPAHRNSLVPAPTAATQSSVPVARLSGLAAATTVRAATAIAPASPTAAPAPGFAAIPQPTPLVAPAVQPSTAGPAPAVAPARAALQTAAVAGTVTQVVDAALLSLLGGGPLNDAQSPLMWTTLAFARRQIGRPSVQTASAGVLTTSQMSPNLLVNPGAEAGDPSLSGFSAVSIPGWTVTGTPTVIKYGTPRNFWPIGLSSPMPNLPPFMNFPATCNGTDGQTQFFGGGNVATSTLTQTVDLSKAKDQIDAGSTTYDLSGYLGGFLLDPSAASVKVTFLSKDKTYLGTAKIGPVTVLDRLLQTGFQQRETTGTLPKGTRYAQVEVDLQDCNPRFLGFRASYNNAYADNLSFAISAPLDAPGPVVDPPESKIPAGSLDHVFMVYMENKGYNDIVGSPNAPFLNSLINAYGFADDYYGLTHPSLPNYYPMVGGTDFGKTYNCNTVCIDVPLDQTLVGQIDNKYGTGQYVAWKGYAQALTPGADPLVPSGDYSPDQLPFAVFSAIANDPAYAKAHLVPLEQMATDLQSSATAPKYAWFAADENFNGEGPVDFPWGALRFVLTQFDPKHQYNVAALDQFLSQTVPTIMNSNVWNSSEKSVIVVTFDEDNNNTSLGFGNQGNHIVTVVIPNKAAIEAGWRGGHFVATDHYNHYSLLRMIEDSLDVPPLTNNDRYAAPMNEFFSGALHSAASDVLV